VTDRASPETPIYAVGDIHGRDDLLDLMLDLIESDAGARPATVVFLGDYIDRGPGSHEVIRTLKRGPRRGGDHFICLKGNHEQLMLEAQAGGRAESLWLQNGGDATRRSYDGDPTPADLDWAADLPLLHETADHIFVHAGLMPGYAVSEQSPEWLMWIRDRFLEAAPEWGRHVVHGHTPQWRRKPDPAEPELLGHRTNLDTKAWQSGVLTAGVFEAPGGPRRLLRRHGPPG
jgi:serine/threonine protein phosphatase 1